MTKVAELQEKVKSLPEPLAEEVLDFLDLLSSRKSSKSEKGQNLRGAFRGKLSTSQAFASRKSEEIRLEEWRK